MGYEKQRATTAGTSQGKGAVKDEVKEQQENDIRGWAQAPSEGEEGNTSPPLHLDHPKWTQSLCTHFYTPVPTSGLSNANPTCVTRAIISDQHVDGRFYLFFENQQPKPIGSK